MNLADTRRGTVEWTVVVPVATNGVWVHHPAVNEGKIMADVIELLETIGRDASLRHAAGQDLVETLTNMGASEGLRMAVASGDDGCLKRELGSSPNAVVHINQNPNQIDGLCDPDDDDPDSCPDQDDEEGDGPNPDS
ncbi:MAG TPA: hypothetical protein VF269_04530 [Rhodanobacteraceae bacterium]